MTREEYDALHTISRMSFKKLADAVTHSDCWRTPFSDEILKRCGKTKPEMDILIRDPVHYISAVRRACASRGIMVYGYGQK